MARYKHGHNTRKGSTSEYQTWDCLIQRCTNPRTAGYANYGGRGIKVCDRWREDFRNFLADMGPKPGPGRRWSIDRIDNDGDYEPGNCRWASRKEQMRNISSNRMLTFGERTQCLAAWSEEVGLSARTIIARIDVCGWSVERALTAPLCIDKHTSALFRGERRTPPQWARKLGLKWPTVRRRMKKQGMSLEEALTTPLKKRC